MSTFKRLRSLGLLSGLFFAVCMLAFTVAQAQTQVDATILTTNVDVQQQKLYVEMNYTPKACGNYQLRFRLEKAGGVNLGYAALELEEVISNNHGTQKIADYGGVTPAIKVLNLDNTAVGGYSLRFALKSLGSSFNPATVSAADTLKVCLETYRIAYRCRYCGTNRSDILFTPRDIDEDCPYKGADLVACARRVSTANNWEVHIQDPRDCRVYRTVQMPDGKWWFAQNLNYQKDLTHTTGSPEPSQVTGANPYHFWCPGPNNSDVLPTHEAGNSNYAKWGCEVYGALYTWYTARRMDGTGTDQSATAPGTATTTSAIRGVCPPDWFIPNDADWGIMLNAVEGCPNPTTVDNNIAPLNPPCNHFRSDQPATIAVASIPMDPSGTGNNANPPSLNSMYINTTNVNTNYFYNLGYQAGKFLKTTPVCPTGVICDNNNLGNTNVATGSYGIYYSPNPTTNPRVQFAFTRWAYSDREATGSDLYGFSVLPAGYRVSSNVANAARFIGRGSYAMFLTSTFYNNNGTSPMIRMFSWDKQDVQRHYHSSTNIALYSAYSVRCVRATADQ